MNSRRSRLHSPLRGARAGRSLAGESSGGSIRVQVDGRPAADTPDVRDGILAPSGSRLYQLVGLEKPGEHILTLDVRGRLRLFAFTFG